ncbi:MAG: prepilin peptidase [Lachnospiraceae bacterium]|nr:prepilin peptidase [Lachnospiraceae bacterium]
MWIIAAGFLIAASITDIRKKEISVILIGLFVATSIVYSIAFQTMKGNDFLYALIPGSSLLALGIMTKESIGYGDGLLILALGILLGLEKCLITVGMGLAASAIYALVLLAFRKVNGKSRLPFVPFLTIGLGVTFLVGYQR